MRSVEEIGSELCVLEDGGLRQLLLFPRDKSFNCFGSLDCSTQQNLPAPLKLVCTQPVRCSFVLTQLRLADIGVPRKRREAQANKSSCFTHFVWRKNGGGVGDVHVFVASRSL